MGRSRAWRNLEAFLQKSGIGSPRAAGQERGGHVSPGDAREPRGGRDPADAARALLRALDAAASQRGASVWVEKTPDHVFRIGLIRRFAPDARFVHVIRRGEDVVPSLRRATRDWGRPRSWARCAAHWAAALLVSERHSSEPGHYVLPYEHLVAEPEREARSLLEWMGLPWEDELLDRYRRGIAGIIDADETWKASSFGEIRERRAAASPERLPRTARWILRAVRSYERLAGARARGGPDVSPR